MLECFSLFSCIPVLMGEMKAEPSFLCCFKKEVSVLLAALDVMSVFIQTEA